MRLMLLLLAERLLRYMDRKIKASEVEFKKPKPPKDNLEPDYDTPSAHVDYE